MLRCQGCPRLRELRGQDIKNQYKAKICLYILGKWFVLLFCICCPLFSLFISFTIFIVYNHHAFAFPLISRIYFSVHLLLMLLQKFSGISSAQVQSTGGHRHLLACSTRWLISVVILTWLGITVGAHLGCTFQYAFTSGWLSRESRAGVLDWMNRRQAKTSIRLFLLPHCGHRATSPGILKLPCPPHHDGAHPQTMTQNLPFLLQVILSQQ